MEKLAPFLTQQSTMNYLTKKKNLLKLPGCHDDNKHVLFPDHSPEITVGLFQWSYTVQQESQSTDMTSVQSEIIIVILL